MKNLSLLFIGLLLIGVSLTATGQRTRTFRGGLIGGMNFSQIDGDGILGYNKLGLMGGVHLRARYRKKMDLCLDMLYDQQGSSPFTEFTKYNSPYQIILDYISFPVYLKYKDWLIEYKKSIYDYYRIEFDAGLAYSRAFRLQGPSGVSRYYSKNNFSFLLGAHYKFNAGLGIGFRYQRAFLPVHTFADQEIVVWVIPYKISFFTTYTF